MTLSQSAAEEIPATQMPPPTRQVRVYHEIVDGHGNRREQSYYDPFVPLKEWPWPSCAEEAAEARVLAEMRKFEFSGYSEEGAYFWARNAPGRNGEVIVPRWRMVPWD